MNRRGFLRAMALAIALPYLRPLTGADAVLLPDVKPVVKATDISDLVAESLRKLGQMKFKDMMTEYQQTVAMKSLVGGKDVAVAWDVVPRSATNDC